jgi:peptidoglycan/LPS O-acetylase OafA/YrhL
VVENSGNSLEEQIHATKALGYRADINGLRGLAVMLVVLYHLGIRTVRGGYVGVDVFFVISGYLISAIIISEVQSAQFSIAKFYERRIRRIGPAFFVVLCATSVAAYVYLLPSELKAFSKSLLSATFSGSNFYFWGKSGYFDTSSDTAPLLHTWSLAVEEQFYLVFPLLILAIQKWAPKKLKLVVVLLAITSLVLGSIQAFLNPSSAFFLPFGRAWELMLGTLLFLKVFPQFEKKWSRELAGWSGLALILAAGLLYSSKTAFPGLSALLPCMGTALIIAAGTHAPSMVGRLLSTRPMVGLGLISYSLYLWHWPVLVFQRLGTMLIRGASAHVAQAAIFGVALAASYLSWRFVEEPFRRNHPPIPRRILFGFAGSGMLVMSVAAIVTVQLGGFPNRYSKEAARVAQYLDFRAASEFRTGKCFITSGNTVLDFDPSVCMAERSDEPNVLLIGDSHAAQLWWGLSNTYRGINFMQATASGCLPTVEQAIRSNPNCTTLMKNIYSDFLATHRVDQVLIAGRWESGDLDRLRATLTWFKNRSINVVLFGPMLQYDTSFPRLLAKSIQLNEPSFADQHRVREFELLDADMSKMSESLNVSYVSFFDVLCGDRHCVEYAQSAPLLSDSSHFTPEGSILFATRLRDSELGAIGRQVSMFQHFQP